MSEHLDMLAFGAHPDDVEIGMGGTIAKYSRLGNRIGICDLTEAELSSNGTVENRRQEAGEAAKRLGVTTRINLGLPDRGLRITDEVITKIVDVIRTYRPSIVFAPYQKDRHPDHGNCSTLIREAVFSSGIRKLAAEKGLTSHRPDHTYYYFINGFHHPDFIVDITDDMERKVKSLEAYESQFVKGPGGVATPLTEGYIEAVVSREMMMGKEVGIKYGEGFKTDKPLLINADLFGGKS